MPTGMRAVICNINYRRLAIGITKENTPMELDGNGQDMGGRGTWFGKLRPGR
jgi:hypothetical protein